MYSKFINNHWFGLFICMIIVLGILIGCFYMYCNKEEYRKHNFPKIEGEAYNLRMKYAGACVFDIDGTINCGSQDNIKEAVRICKEKNYVLAINTARPYPFVRDVGLKELGFVIPYYNDSDLYYNSNSYKQTIEYVSKIKSNYLEIIRQKYNIEDKKKVIFLDDIYENINTARNEGFSTIYVDGVDLQGKKTCGITRKHIMELNKLLSI